MPKKSKLQIRNIQNGFKRTREMTSIDLGGINMSTQTDFEKHSKCIQASIKSLPKFAEFLLKDTKEQTLLNIVIDLFLIFTLIKVFLSTNKRQR